jgi:hypothetical protein
MPTLRKLSVIYLLCATWFTVAIAFDRDPPLERAARSAAGVTLAVLEKQVVRPGAQLVRHGANRMIAALYPPAPPAKKVARAASPAQVRPTPRREARVVIPPARPLIASAPHLVSPPLPEATVPELQVAQTAPPPKIAPIAPSTGLRTRPTIVPPPSAEPSPSVAARESLAPAELVRVSMRLKENLTREMLENFGLFLYVSKADKGPWAQRLYVFRKDAGDNLTLLYNWPASTGREKFEIAPNGTRQRTITPAGYYEIDPLRMYQTHYSGEWREPMPYAMFFNWENHGYQTGLAIHGAAGVEVAGLGTRASAGCVRIAPENAQLLFGLIRAQYRGLAPRFAFDQRTATMSNSGMLMHDAAGNLQKTPGYKVLVFVEDFGGENVVAALF